MQPRHKWYKARDFDSFQTKTARRRSYLICRSKFSAMGLTFDKGRVWWEVCNSRHRSFKASSTKWSNHREQVILLNIPICTYISIRWTLLQAFTKC